MAKIFKLIIFFGQKVQAFMKNYQTKRCKTVLTGHWSDQDQFAEGCAKEDNKVNNKKMSAANYWFNLACDDVETINSKRHKFKAELIAFLHDIWSKKAKWNRLDEISYLAANFMCAGHCTLLCFMSFFGQELTNSTAISKLNFFSFYTGKNRVAHCTPEKRKLHLLWDKIRLLIMIFQV